MHTPIARRCVAVLIGDPPFGGWLAPARGIVIFREGRGAPRGDGRRSCERGSCSRPDGVEEFRKPGAGRGDLFGLQAAAVLAVLGGVLELGDPVTLVVRSQSDLGERQTRIG